MIRKKLTSIITSAVMCLSMANGVITVSAENYSNEMKYYDSLCYKQVDKDEDGTYDYVEITDCEQFVKEVEIPSEIDGLPVTSIGAKAFSVCSELSNITLPDSITSIGEHAFSDCSRLSNITIPDGVTSIGNFAFSECRMLSNITIPDGVTSIETETFFDCSNLSNITLPDSVTSIGMGAFAGCSSLESITLPSGVTSIAEDAFMACSSLSDVTIPDGVTSIKYRTFWGCSSLVNVTIPNSVTTIGDDAFCLCSNLANITIPDSVTSIKNYAFANCTSLTSIEIPKNVDLIECYSFAECTSLTNINVSENNNNYSSIDGVLFNKDKTEIVMYPKGKKSFEYTIPDSVTSIGGCAFFNSNLKSVEISDSVTSIENGAFISCLNLENITIPNSVTSIGGSVFYGCKALKSVKISDSLTTIGMGTFDNCTNLTSIEIPNSVTLIEESTFYNCTSLTSITIPNSVTSIEKNAFACSNLSSVILPNSVTSIAERAFGDCSNLEKITIENPKCKIYDAMKCYYDECYNGVVCGYKNSTAQAYAEKNGYTFEAVDKEVPVTTAPPTTTINTNTSTSTTTSDYYTLEELFNMSDEEFFKLDGAYDYYYRVKSDVEYKVDFFDITVYGGISGMLYKSIFDFMDYPVKRKYQANVTEEKITELIGDTVKCTIKSPIYLEYKEDMHYGDLFHVYFPEYFLSRGKGDTVSNEQIMEFAKCCYCVNQVMDLDYYNYGYDLAGYSSYKAVIGDVNFDTKVDKIDIEYMEKGLSGKLNLTESEKKIADVNRDGEFNNLDVEILNNQLNADKYAVSENVKASKYGDLNDTETVDVADIVKLNLFLLNSEEYPLTDVQKANADCCKDGVIDANDCSTIMNYVCMIIGEDELGK